ncbi:hypothetical protein ABZW18_02800 [Streptomyces sp. NPDC004647]|uniref:hypothetical protein n=1 Tax=Streptomyces sp. NPDC004647 TaxID=3154671 RepID=UPI0033A16F39
MSFMQGLFNMTSDSHLFHTRAALEADGWTLRGNVFTRGKERILPLYEGRMGHQYNHRFADATGSHESTIAELNAADFVVHPHYWISLAETRKRQDRRRFECRTGMLGHRRVARNNDERTCISTIIPWGAASYGWILSAGPSAKHLTWLEASFNSFPYDYALRNSLSQPSVPQITSEQVPVPTPELLVAHGSFIGPRVLELTYTAHDMAPFAADLGDTGAPFLWDKDRRMVIRAELDALFFHLYGIKRDDVDYIMDTFPIVKRKDEAAYGTYRTKELILEIYDDMTTAIRTGKPYKTILDPTPGHGPRHAKHSARDPNRETPTSAHPEGGELL